MDGDTLISEAVMGMTANRFTAWAAEIRGHGAQAIGPVEIPADSGRLAHEYVVRPGQSIYIRQDPSGLFRLWQPPWEPRLSLESTRTKVRPPGNTRTQAGQVHRAAMHGRGTWVADNDSLWAA